MPTPRASALLPILVLAAAGSLAAETSVSGRVVTHNGQRTVAMARVSVIARDVSRPGNFTVSIIAVTKTDDRGRYWLTGLPSARVALGIERNGYFTKKAGGHDGDRVVLDCTQPEDCSEVDFEMGRAAVITGRVVDELGEPIAEARVTARTSAAENRDSRRHASSDDRGVFRLANLRPGKYELRVRGSRSRRFRDALEAERTEIEVEEGDEIRGVQIILRARVEEQSRFQLSGRVTGVDLSGSGRHLISLRRGGGRAMVPLQDDGAFTLGSVRPGKYALSYIHRSDSIEPDGRLRLPLGSVEINGDISGLVLSPRPQTGLEGRVVFDGGLPEGGLPKAEVDLIFRAYDGEHLASADAEPPDFEFETMGLSPGTYQVDVSRWWVAPSSYFVKEVRLGGKSAPDRTIDLAEGHVEQIEVVLSTEFAKVHGRVKKPREEGEVRKAAQYRVGLKSGHLIRSVQADQYGRFMFDKVPPGDYRICAWPDLSARAVRDEDVWEEANSAARAFPVEAGSDVEIDLTAVP